MFVGLIMFIMSIMCVSATDELLNGLIAKYKFENTAPLTDSINSYNLSKDTPAETISGVIGYAINLNASTCGHIGYCDTNYCFNFNSNTCIVCDIYDQCSDPNDCWSDDYSDCFPADMLQECFNNPIDEIDCGSYCFVESNKSCIPSNYSQVYSYDSAFKLDSEFTINAWVYKTASSNWLDQIVGSGGWANPDYYGYTFAICTDPICVNGNLTALIFDGDADFDFFTGGEDIIINEWLMATMVFSNSNNYIAVYVNGTLIYNRSVFTNPIYYTGDVFQTIMLGQANLGTATNFYGFMDELAFINRTWSPQEVEWVFNSELHGTAFEDNATVLYEESCIVNWSCSAYNSCGINNLKTCNTVYDNNNCSINYTGNYSEFNQECFLCSGEILINSTFNESSLFTSGWVNDSIAGGNAFLFNSTFYNEFDNVGLARIYQNLTNFDILNNSVVHIKFIRSDNTPTFTSELRFGYSSKSMQFIVLSNTGNFTFFGLGNTCASSNLTDGEEFYLAPYDTNPHNIDYHFYNNGTMDLYFDNVYRYTFSFSGCDVNDKIELVSRFTAEKTDELFICGVNIPPCVPNWSCSLFDTCNISDLTVCTDVIDSNSCGELYGGNFSEFGVFTCNYCTGLVSSGSLICINNTAYQINLNTNFGQCCNVTDITADCVLNGFDYRINNGTYLYTESCVTPPTVSFNYVIGIIIFIGALCLVCGLMFNIPLFTFFSGLIWFLLGAYPFIETPIIRILIGVFGAIVMIVFGLSIQKS